MFLQDELSPSEAYEHSELLAYKGMVLQEGGQAEAALSLLEQQQVRRLMAAELAGAGRCWSAAAAAGEKADWCRAGALAPPRWALLEQQQQQQCSPCSSSSG